jgi:hypothetical protein
MAKLPRYPESITARVNGRNMSFGLGWAKRPAASGAHKHWTPQPAQFTTNPLLLAVLAVTRCVPILVGENAGE